jgi:hypothetical protein
MPAESSGPFGYWRDPLFLVCLGTYAVNRLLIKPNLHHYSPLFHGHLNDTLTVPVALPIYLWFYRVIRLRPDDEYPRWWEVACHVAVWCVFFEWFGPHYLHHGAGDRLDNISIAGGGFAGWVLWRLAGARPVLHAT